MSLLDLVLDPQFRSVLMVLWLLPCAIQDRRTRHVSNWLTVPLFVLAWPVALLTGNLPLTCAVFVGVLLAWRWGGGLGPADGKIAVGLAGMAPPALLISVIVQGLMFLWTRLCAGRPAPLPGAVGFYLGAMLCASLSAMNVR
jgi:Flp pilus assembly protein protease CpaA